MASHRAANQGYVYGTAARNMAAERERTRKQRVVQYRQDMSGCRQNHFCVYRVFQQWIRCSRCN